MKNKKKSRGNDFRFSYSDYNSVNKQGEAAFKVAENYEKLANNLWEQAKVARSVYFHYKNGDKPFLSDKQWDMIKNKREDAQKHWDIINRSIARNKEK